MANPPPPPVPSAATAIINPQYCAPHPVDLIIKKGNILSEYFKVKDTNGNVVFTLENPLVTFVTPRNHRFVRDAHGNPVVHLRRSVAGQISLSIRANLNVFLANNNTTEICDFKVKSSFFGESSVVYIGESDTVVAQIRKELGPVFFNTQKVTVTVSPNIGYAFIVALVMTLDNCEGSSQGKLGMHEKHTVKSILIGKDHFMVTVYPNIDYAFIVALIVILDEIDED